jgi:N-acetylglutamate synthase-like GNAT family acetyltransferase
MKITIEFATQNDYHKFTELHERFYCLGSNEPSKLNTVTNGVFEDYVERESMLLAYQGNVAIGYAMLVAYRDENNDIVCSIQEIFVAPEYQRNGYGREILKKIIEEAKKIEAKKLQVVSFFIETDHFWINKCGFKEDEGGYLVKEIN